MWAQTAESFAGWREDMKSFRIGMIAEPGGGQTVTGLAMLKQSYARALGIPVEIFVARDYAALIDAQATGRVDYALYSTTAYATAALLCACVEPVVAPVGEDGATGIKAILVTRDARLSKASDVSTHRVAIARLDSVAGFVLPQLELAVGQVALTGSEPFLVHVDSASAAEAMLVDGSVDAIFGWLPANADTEFRGGTLQRLEDAGMDEASLSVVWRSSLLRYGPHALRSGLDAELRTTLVAFLTGLKAIAAGYLRLPRTASWWWHGASSRRRLCDGDRDGARAHPRCRATLTMIPKSGAGPRGRHRGHSII